MRIFSNWSWKKTIILSSVVIFLVAIGGYVYYVNKYSADALAGESAYTPEELLAAKKDAIDLRTKLAKEPASLADYQFSPYLPKLDDATIQLAADYLKTERLATLDNYISSIDDNGKIVEVSTTLYDVKKSLFMTQKEILNMASAPTNSERFSAWLERKDLTVRQKNIAELNSSIDATVKSFGELQTSYDTKKLSATKAKAQSQTLVDGIVKQMETVKQSSENTQLDIDRLNNQISQLNASQKTLFAAPPKPLTTTPALDEWVDDYLSQQASKYSPSSSMTMTDKPATDPADKKTSMILGKAYATTAATQNTSTAVGPDFKINYGVAADQIQNADGILYPQGTVKPTATIKQLKNISLNKSKIMQATANDPVAGFTDKQAYAFNHDTYTIQLTQHALALNNKLSNPDITTAEKALYGGQLTETRSLLKAYANKSIFDVQADGSLVVRPDLQQQMVTQNAFLDSIHATYDNQLIYFNTKIPFTKQEFYDAFTNYSHGLSYAQVKEALSADVVVAYGEMTGKGTWGGSGGAYNPDTKVVETYPVVGQVEPLKITPDGDFVFSGWSNELEKMTDIYTQGTFDFNNIGMPTTMTFTTPVGQEFTLLAPTDPIGLVQQRYQANVNDLLGNGTGDGLPPVDTGNVTGLPPVDTRDANLVHSVFVGEVGPHMTSDDLRKINQDWAILTAGQDGSTALNKIGELTNNTGLAGHPRSNEVIKPTLGPVNRYDTSMAINPKTGNVEYRTAILHRDSAGELQPVGYMSFDPLSHSVDAQLPVYFGGKVVTLYSDPRLGQVYVGFSNDNGEPLYKLANNVELMTVTVDANGHFGGSFKLFNRVFNFNPNTGAFEMEIYKGNGASVMIDTNGNVTGSYNISMGKDTTGSVYFDSHGKISYGLSYKPDGKNVLGTVVIGSDGQISGSVDMGKIVGGPNGASVFLGFDKSGINSVNIPFGSIGGNPIGISYSANGLGLSGYIPLGPIPVPIALGSNAKGETVLSWPGGHVKIFGDEDRPLNAPAPKFDKTTQSYLFNTIYFHGEYQGGVGGTKTTRIYNKQTIKEDEQIARGDMIFKVYNELLNRNPGTTEFMNWYFYNDHEMITGEAHRLTGTPCGDAAFFDRSAGGCTGKDVTQVSRMAVLDRLLRQTIKHGGSTNTDEVPKIAQLRNGAEYKWIKAGKDPLNAPTRPIDILTVNPFTGTTIADGSAGTVTNLQPDTTMAQMSAAILEGCALDPLITDKDTMCKK